MTLPTQVTLLDVGPRDGLQNEKTQVSTEHKAQLVGMLQDAGLKEIEVTSFVSPKWVPQMGDNAAVMAAIERRADVRYSVLTPNMKGFEAALPGASPGRSQEAPHPLGGSTAYSPARGREVWPQEIVVFAAASEAFSQKNINCSIAESIERFAPVVQAAHAAGIKVRAALSCCLGCPYEGEITPDQVERVVKLLKEVGVDHMSIADTIGVGTPKKTQAVMERALKHFPLHEVSGHFHDTYGQSLSNIYASLELGIAKFDASVSGLGGCPYAKGATGNVATEDVLFMLNGLGIETGIDIDKLVDAGAFISNVLGRAPVSRVGRALLAKRAG